MNLTEMSTTELKALKKKLEKRVDALDNEQMAFKILINSAYGAIGSPYFRFFNVVQASAITISGQTTIRAAEKALNKYLDGLLGEKDRVVAIDTDSVIGSTVVEMNSIKKPIADWYDIISKSGKFLVNDEFNKNYVVEPSGCYTSPSMDSDFNIEDKKVNYIMKHTVTKEMFEISCDGDTVVVTEDHSVIVLRNNRLKSVKPMDIVDTDCIVKV